MKDLSTTIAGVTFENPIIVGASVLTNRLEKLRKLAEAGAGGIVTKLIQPPELIPQFHEFASKGIATKDGFFLVGDAGMKLDDGIRMVKNAKRELKIPVIASIGGRPNDLGSWVNPAGALADAGADMLELDMWPEYGISEQKALSSTMKELKSVTGLPIIMKMTPLIVEDYVGLARRGMEAGADAISGSNVLSGICPPDIERDFRNPYPDIVKMGYLTFYPYFGPWQNPISLLYTMKLARSLKLPIISGGGIGSWQNVVERIAFGASAVSVVSAVILNGLSIISKFTKELEGYLDRHGWNGMSEIQGAGLKNFSDGDNVIVQSPEIGRLSDPGNAWPNKLSDEWWTTPG